VVSLVIRVGFRLIGGAAWQGGRTYLWNLLHAITAHVADRVQPVLLVRRGEDPGDLQMPGVEVVTTGVRFARAGRLIKLAIRFDPAESHWLHRARIDVLSHAPPVGFTVPTIAWIPDVQHRHLPELSSRRERFARDLLFREALRDAAITLASSENARRDLERFYRPDPARLRVLPFVSQPRVTTTIPLAQLQSKFGLPTRFVHLPNQLWKHKNHALVVEALRAAPEVVVVATGPTEDYRHAGIYDQLMARVGELGLAARFRHLGLVSFAELISLMRHAVAVVNPSRFEGWSTTVEEAKSLGKRVLVSDLAVHREQAPARASYFGIDDADALATQLRAAWRDYDPAEDARAAAEAAAALPARTRAFAEHYASIVLDAARRSS
jgi:glycosyltransferase involved in cell wall biosynthesis